MTLKERLYESFKVGAITTILAVIIVYTLGLFWAVPYVGLQLEVCNGEVGQIYDTAQREILFENEIVTQIDGVELEDLCKDPPRTSLWDVLDADDLVTLRVLRNNQFQTVDWEISGKTPQELTGRLISPWLLSLTLWFFGLTIYVSVLPRSEIRNLLTSICFASAIWLSMAGGPAGYQLWQSNYLIRILSWPLAVMMVHLHWYFPKKFKWVSTRANRTLAVMLYLSAIILSVYEFLYPGTDLYIVGLNISLLICIALLSLHYATQKETRRHIKTIFLTAALIGLVMFPYNVIITGKVTLDSLREMVIYAGLLAVPSSFLIIIWRGKLAGYQFRAHRMLSTYLFALLVLVSGIVATTLLADTYFNPTSSIIILVVTSLVTTQLFPLFQQIVDKYLFKVPIPLTQLVQSYSSRLDSTQDTASISTLLGDLILPALMVRQSVLLEVLAPNQARIMDARGVSEVQVPTSQQVQQLVTSNQNLIAPQQAAQTLPRNLHWIRVMLPLRFDNELIGVWLLGRRDPNDLYDEQTVRILNALAQQTSIAMVNRQKSLRLRTLFQANIDRDEIERANLARDLHDVTLNDLAVLQRQFKDPRLMSGISSVIASLRKTIQGLRPETLSYGLVTALYDLVDILNERQTETIVTADLEGEPVALPSNTELHLYRIIQQACENVVYHAEAKTLQIRGSISETSILVEVVDDGKGFNQSILYNLNDLITERHYGLAGMHERAELVNADLIIETQIGKGTKVIVRWPKTPKPS